MQFIHMTSQIVLNFAIPPYVLSTATFTFDLCLPGSPHHPLITINYNSPS